ncbi:MAG TPA: rhodanese-like domain-containing protein [Gammaproteobacteria bacterium]|nr:rhodanese-like domain-containing protein [Gammaproteobacteria bacterium]
MTSYDFSRASDFFKDRIAFTTGPHELKVLVEGNTDPATYQVVDVRYPADFAAGHVPGAVNLPNGRWRNPRGLDKNATLYLYCYNPTCHMAAAAAVELVAQGYRVVEVEGGWDTWVANGYRIERLAESA